MNTKIGLLAAAMTIGLVASASAEQLRGPYVGIAGGVNLEGFSNDANIKLTGPRGQNFNANGSLSRKTGWVVLGTLGYAFGNGFRIELEPGYRYNKVDNLKVQGNTIAKSGHLDSWSVMANALYDIPTGTPITPYIGGGVGIAWVHGEGNNNANNINTSHSFSDTQTEFAYQGIAGVDYSVTPQLKIGISYHYFATPDVKLKDHGLQEKISYGNNEILLGLRYTFGQPQMAAMPAPAPAPAPAPEMARSFTVFFDWNKSTITPEADAILKEAADVAKNGGVAKITVTGHTDTSGSKAYNQRLSERRAAAVKARLVQYGLGADEITTIGVGESDLLVPTKDGVREAKNRRAEIVFQ